LPCLPRLISLLAEADAGDVDAVRAIGPIPNWAVRLRQGLQASEIGWQVEPPLDAGAGEHSLQRIEIGKINGEFDREGAIEAAPAQGLPNIGVVETLAAEDSEAWGLGSTLGFGTCAAPADDVAPCTALFPPGAVATNRRFRGLPELFNSVLSLSGRILSRGDSSVAAVSSASADCRRKPVS
jgi:hypothetical protein